MNQRSPSTIAVSLEINTIWGPLLVLGILFDLFVVGMLVGRLFA